MTLANPTETLYQRLAPPSQFTYKTKTKIFKANVISVLLYGCECWRMTKTDEKKPGCVLTQEPSSDIKDLMANADNKRGD